MKKSGVKQIYRHIKIKMFFALDEKVNFCFVT